MHGKYELSEELFQTVHQKLENGATYHDIQKDNEYG